MALLVRYCRRTRGGIPTVFIRGRGGRLDQWSTAAGRVHHSHRTLRLLDCSSTRTPVRTWLCSHALRPLVLRPLSAQSKLKASTFRNSARMVCGYVIQSLHYTTLPISSCFFSSAPLIQQRTTAHNRTQLHTHTTRVHPERGEKADSCCSEAWPPLFLESMATGQSPSSSLPAQSSFCNAKDLSTSYRLRVRVRLRALLCPTSTMK